MTAASEARKRDRRDNARQAIEERRAILGPCLAAMGFSEHGAPPPVLPESLKFNGLELPLDSWERSLLLGEFAGDPAVLLAHFAEGIAFRALSGHRLRSLEDEVPRPLELEQARQAMVEETAVGRAIQTEVQRDIDRLVGMGEMGDAKRLTGFRRKIDQALAKLEQKIGVQAREQAQARSVELLTPRDARPAERKLVPPPVEKGLKLEDLVRLEKEIDQEIAEKPPEPSPEELFEASLREQTEDASEEFTPAAADLRVVAPKRRLGLLVALLVISFVAYGMILWSNREPVPPPRLEMEHFQHIAAVLDVKPRPPSLFVLVKVSKWKAMPTEEKTQLIDELGRIAGEKGYSGVQVKANDGTNVGQWLRKTGTKLVIIPESAS